MCILVWPTTNKISINILGCLTRLVQYYFRLPSTLTILSSLIQCKLFNLRVWNKLGGTLYDYQTETFLCGIHEVYKGMWPFFFLDCTFWVLGRQTMIIQLLLTTNKYMYTPDEWWLFRQSTIILCWLLKCIKVKVLQTNTYNQVRARAVLSGQRKAEPPQSGSPH